MVENTKNYLFFILKFFTVKAIKQQGKEEVEHHEVSHNERGKENKEATFRTARLLRPHAVPQWLDPLSAEYAEYHHERVEEIVEVPPY